MTEYIQVLTTLETKEDARAVANEVVAKKLAACAQVIGPITSTYWWEGIVEEAEEWLLIMKTRKGLYDDLERVIKEMHFYEVPEILAVPVVEGNPDYLRWLDREVKEQ
ncbi:MAG: divalent-cation tolerance protein CutA [Deltaproteobacteria bacterium]|nr:divalent-cation tolerance protein CutA [Deltaproteobacteria bacterium]